MINQTSSYVRVGRAWLFRGVPETSTELRLYEC